jgi:hypothetical protein
MYRRREDLGAATDTSKLRKEYYTVLPELFLSYIAEESLRRYGKVLPFISYTLAYAMIPRFRKCVADKVLSSGELAAYEEKIVSVLKLTDDDAIFAQTELPIADRMLMYRLKYGEEPMDTAEYRAGKFYYKGHSIANVGSPNMVVFGPYKDGEVSGLTRVDFLRGRGSFVLTDTKSSEEYTIVPAPDNEENTRRIFTGYTVQNRKNFRIDLTGAKGLWPDDYRLEYRYGGETLPLKMRFSEELK